MKRTVIFNQRGFDLTRNTMKLQRINLIRFQSNPFSWSQKVIVNVRGRDTVD